ncbi:MFS general substrate transporter [Aspergillus ellipticus CBS 707.79]|uniref:MFS general substrate transporter n=1 Tax=Aspergillus ellipticus CBS 707.79 TaxID=1448320 RepID=A0A319D0W3_9EURO|nr:MFS general substrate transporter [Aspergillus ellipticus CBS 707.79]
MRRMSSRSVVEKTSASDPEKEARQETSPEQEAFSVFTVNQKRAMVAVGSLASFFSPLSSSIYFPALDTIADALNVTTSKIDLTVTTYLIMQGVAPMLIAGFSDTAGRRPAYIICFAIYLAANLGLGLQNDYGALLGLRCLQSAGSSGTVALANGLVGDLITSAERGTYIAFASLGSMLGPSLSPIIGGLLSQYLNWHWIFWFLLIFSGVFFALLAWFLPETCRKVVADGSVPPPALNQSVSDLIRHRNRKARGLLVEEAKLAEVRNNYAFRVPSPMPTLRVVVDLETGAILLATGLMFAGFYAVMTGATTSFHEVYHLNNIETGLMYIPIGAGGIASAFTTGRLVDWNYRRHAARAGLPVIRNVRQDISNFNIERARLEVALPLYYLSLVSMVAYGWVLGRKVNLAVPIILLFICGWTLNATSQVLNALMVDLWPGRSAAATAANNLFRCELGAASSAAITPMSEAMGKGWAYTTLALISLAASPTLWIMMRSGIKWRQKRLRKEQEKQQEKEARGSH